LFVNDKDTKGLDDSTSSSREYETLEFEEEAKPCEGHLLMLRRLLETQPI